MDTQLIYIISDSLGETAEQNAKAAISQFKQLNYETRKFSHVRSSAAVKEIINEITSDDILFYSLVNSEIKEQLEEACDEKQISRVDVIGNSIEMISRKTGLSPSTNAGALRELDENYFKRVAAIEFAVKYDDGKDPKGLLKADICLIGISRTSKTPLSMYLANKNFKVANIPLVPETTVPKELFEIDSSKVIGLTNSPENLNRIRKERMKNLGISSGSYTDLSRILEEIDFAHDIMKRIGCPIIDVSNKAIEETADIIINYIKKTKN